MNAIMIRVATAAALALLPAMAQAHPGHGELGGLLAGVGHPWAGLDHLLAMLAVGLWGAQLGGRARWALPVLFVAFMLVGAVAGVAGLVVAGLEQAILGSVMALGLLLLRARRVSLAPGALIVSAFALVHGLAHGMEMPGEAHLPAYMLGFALSTAALHLAGIGLGSCRAASVTRLLGAGIALAGMGLALS